METQDKQRVAMQDPAALRPHPLRRGIPGPVVESAEWHAFVDAWSAAGPEGMPALAVTAEGLILDGERRWRAARQLGWEGVPCVERGEWEAALVVVESLMGQRSLTKGVKVYLCLPLMEEYAQAAEMRRLNNLRAGRKLVGNAQKPLIFPKAHSVRSREDTGKASEALAERLGCSARLVEQAVRIRKIFELTDGREFEFADGVKRSLRGYFEPRLLDPEGPMGLGEVLKGLGWFVDGAGREVGHGAPARNTYLHYFEAAWSKVARHCERWVGLGEAERAHALGVVRESMRGWPEAVLEAIGAEARAELRRRARREDGLGGAHGA